MHMEGDESANDEHGGDVVDDVGGEMSPSNSTCARMRSQTDSVSEQAKQLCCAFVLPKMSACFYGLWGGEIRKRMGRVDAAEEVVGRLPVRTRPVTSAENVHVARTVWLQFSSRTVSATGRHFPPERASPEGVLWGACTHTVVKSLIRFSEHNACAVI